MEINGIQCDDTQVSVVIKSDDEFSLYAEKKTNYLQIIAEILTIFNVENVTLKETEKYVLLKGEIYNGKKC